MADLIDTPDDQMEADGAVEPKRLHDKQVASEYVQWTVSRSGERDTRVRQRCTDQFLFNGRSLTEAERGTQRMSFTFILCCGRLLQLNERSNYSKNVFHFYTHVTRVRGIKKPSRVRL